VQTNPQLRFGARILKLRTTKKWTQEDVCDKSGISVKHLGSLENGHREPCLGTILKLAKCFNVTASFLLRGVDAE
jgi:transcriptional regulator with XRE-family HTH domain